MSITTVESITINSSQNFLGGQIYNLRFERGFNGQPSNIEANIIAESKNYQVPDLNYTSPYHISLGGIYNFDFFAYKYCISDGQNGRILTVSFQDGINKLRRYWIAPVGQVCSSANVIFVGSTPNNVGLRSINQAQGLNQTSSLNGPPTNSLSSAANQKNVPFGSYSYAQFQAATAFLGIPNISTNNLVRITQEGTVLDIFNHFMNLYGYTWYLDGDIIKLIDIKKSINIDSSLISSMEAHPRRLSSNMCTDISNNYVRGAVALDDGENTDKNDPNSGSFILSAAKALWDGTDVSTSLNFSISAQQSNVKILDIPLLAGYGPRAALYAVQSPQLYFAYIYSRFNSLETALEAMGLSVYQNTRLDQLTQAPDLQSNQFGDSASPFDSTSAANVQIIVHTDIANDGLQSFYERDRLLGQILLQGYYTIQDVNSSVQWDLGSPQILNPDTKFSELQQFNGLIFDNSTIKSKTTQNVWLLSFPVSLDDQFSRIMTPTFLEQINSFFPHVLPIPAKSVDSETYVDSKFMLSRVDMTHASSIAGNFPKLNYPISAIRYVRGDLNSTDLRLGNVTQKEVPIYGMGGRKIVACNIPTVKPETSNLDIVTFENIEDDVPNVKAFVAQNTYSKNNPDVEYEWVIRGIATGLDLTPEKGLDNISISLDENGYSTTYHLSSKRGAPPTPESLKGIKQFVPIT